jgi:hypothetical protein
MSEPDQGGGSWTLLTGHGHVLVEIARNPDARIRDISPIVGLTERTVQAIVADLEAAGYLTRARTGRRTRYTVNHDSQFRHSAQEGLRVGPLLALLTQTGDDQGHADPPQKPTRRRTGNALSLIASGRPVRDGQPENLHNKPLGLRHVPGDRAAGRRPESWRLR